MHKQAEVTYEQLKAVGAVIAWQFVLVLIAAVVCLSIALSMLILLLTVVKI